VDTDTWGKMFRSIGAVSRLTGLSPHTLRAWERRYSAVAPSRNQQGQRIYSARDIERLQILSSLVLSGYAIGSIATLSGKSLKTLRDQDSAIYSKIRTLDFRKRIMEGIHGNRAAESAALLHAAASCLSTYDFLAKIVVPLMRDVGTAWQKGNLHFCQEHVITRLITRVLRFNCQILERVVSGPNVLLTTLPDEQHVMGTLAASYFIRSHGVRTCIPGESRNMPEIAAVAERSGCSVLGLSIGNAKATEFVPSILELRALVPESIPIWIGGTGIVGRKPKLPSNVVPIHSLKSLSRSIELIPAVGLTLDGGKVRKSG